jgi:hypothetical protein
VREHRKAVTILRQIPGVSGVQMFGERAHVRLDRTDANGADLLASKLTGAGLAVTSVRPIPTSLEDVFIARLFESAGGGAPAP